MPWLGLCHNNTFDISENKITLEYCYALHGYNGFSHVNVIASAMIIFLHNGISPPQMDINQPSTNGHKSSEDCVRLVMRRGNRKKLSSFFSFFFFFPFLKGHTCNLLAPWNAFVITAE